MQSRLAMRLAVFLVAGHVILAPPAATADPPLPGSPRTLTDWRWLARPGQGSRHVLSDPWGKRELAAVEGGHRLLEISGPGVLDHLWTVVGKGSVSISADGREVWNGELDPLAKAAAKGDGEAVLFPNPVCFGAGGMLHLLAPIGFQASLEVRVARPRFPHFLSYRTFPEGTGVFPADPDRGSEYARELREAARVWREGGSGFASCLPESAEEQVREFTLQAQARCVAFEGKDSGELLRLEFHVNPALVGSLRDVLAEFTYDGHGQPSLRLPLTDVAGVPHPWAIHRWHAYNGNLAAGIRYPWQVNRPRFHYPEATCLLNLPVPYLKGLRIELLNRSSDVRFTGSVKAWVQSLSPEAAVETGRLCGTRTFVPLVAGTEPQPLIGVPGPGKLVALGLSTSGGDRHSAAVRNSVSSLAVDDNEPITGHGLLPLWFQGVYGGPVCGMPIWNHPGFHDRYGSVTRHFLTDPIPFESEATLAFTPGPSASGLPTHAITTALWYRFAAEPYVAPDLPGRAEALPYSDFGLSSLHMQRERQQLEWLTEAEDLVAMASASGCRVRAVEDSDHNVHPSRGKYLLVAAGRPGDYVDCLVPLPRAQYVRIGLVTLWGPGLGDFEIDVLSRQQARGGPRFEQGGEFYTGRAIGSVPMKAPILMGHSLQHRRDTGVEYSVPFANPAPDGSGVLRFICRGKPLTSNSHLLRLDQVCLKTPPPTDEGWREFECGVTPEVGPEHLMESRVPKYGRTDWSGWGAVLLSAREGGVARFRAALPVGPSAPTALVVRGCLGPKQGSWQVQLLGNTAPPVTLTPGKDEGQIMEWRVPVEGVSLPGFTELEAGCRGAAEKAPRERVVPPARLVLDAWTMQ